MGEGECDLAKQIIDFRFGLLEKRRLAVCNKCYAYCWMKDQSGTLIVDLGQIPSSCLEKINQACVTKGEISL